MKAKIPNPAPDGYLRVAWASSGPIWSKWVGEGAEPASEIWASLDAATKAGIIGNWASVSRDPAIKAMARKAK